MEFLRRHGAILALWLIIAFVFYNIGYRSGENGVSGTALSIENAESAEAPLDFSPFWKAWNILNEKYVPASTTVAVVEDEEKLYGAISGLAASLDDPYTVFFPPVESKLFESDIRGNFEGVGMEVLAEDGAITIIAPLKNSPASRAGILAGDRIVKINGKKEPFEIEVIRDVIDIPTAATKELPGGIFVIELYSFSAQAPNLFRAALREFIVSGNDKLIIDLRGNPGGYLEAAIDMASWFLPSSMVVV